MRVHGSPIRIGGCDSTLFTIVHFERQLEKNSLRLGLENLRDQLRVRSRLAAVRSGQAGQQWPGGLLRTSLSSADTSEPDLPQSLSLLPVVPVLLPCL